MILTENDRKGGATGGSPLMENSYEPGTFAFPDLPERLSGLGRLSYNLWWSGSREPGCSTRCWTARHGKRRCITR